MPNSPAAPTRRRPWRQSGRKILAVLLAVISWYAIRGAISFENAVTGVPLTIRLDEEWAVLDRSTDVVDVVFKGSRDDLFRLSRSNVELGLDLRGREHAGTTTVRLTGGMIAAPGSARAIEITPPEVTVVLDQQATRQVPVNVTFQDELPAGFELESFQADPATVRVSGPRQMIETLASVRTVAIPLESRRHSFRDRVELEQPSDAWQARFDPPRVNMRVTIRERSETRTFSSVPIRLLMTPAQAGLRLDLMPESVDVVVRGASARLASLEADHLEAYLEVGELTGEGQQALAVRVNTPSGVLLEATDPPHVKVTLHAGNQERKEP